MTVTTTLLLIGCLTAWVLCLGCYERIGGESGSGRVLTVWAVAGALVGGVLALLGALVLNGVLRVLASDAYSTGTILASAFGEEAIKAAAVIGLLYWMHHSLSIRETVLYGALVGLGFASAEAVLYILQFGSEVVWVRMLWTAPAHMSYTVICVFGLLAWQRGRPLMLLIAFGWGTMAHAGTNLLMLQDALGPALGALALFFCSLVLAHHLLRRSIAGVRRPVPAVSRA